MPNGRPGDHPLTDILKYGGSEYPDDINQLVKELSALPRFESIRGRVADALWQDWPHWQNVTPDFVAVRQKLAELRNEIASDTT